MLKPRGLWSNPSDACRTNLVSKCFNGVANIVSDMPHADDSNDAKHEP